jgi:hypothetical protein
LHGETDSIKIVMKFLFDCLRIAECRLRLLKALNGSFVSKATVASSVTFSCFSPATENAWVNRSTFGGRGFLPLAMSMSFGATARNVS